MKLLLICGARNPQGQTATAAGAILAGYERAGGQVERVFLPTLHLERCRQCEDSGWGTCRSEGHCVIDDDLDLLVAKVRAADAVVFATPVYYGDLAESIRAFTDRFRRTATHMADTSGIKGKPAVGLCVAGGGGGGAPNCCLSLERVVQRIGFDLVDVIPARRQNLAAQLPRLEQVGAWLATAPHS
ncbi:MAG: flavodoxin family protein [Chloroflexi bacterium]|nr:flavodoxin family protein [Chloroflexota bacterium]